MKRAVSFVSPVLAGVLAAGLLAGCGAAKIGKTEFADLCTKRMGSAEKCGCYADNVEKALSPEQFSKVASGAHQLRDVSGSTWIPNTVTSDATVSEALNAATTACFT